MPLVEDGHDPGQAIEDVPRATGYEVVRVGGAEWALAANARLERTIRANPAGSTDEGPRDDVGARR